MELEWDEEKRQRTLNERGLDFADIVDFDFVTGHTTRDSRFEYGETRNVTVGYLHDRLCVLCWTLREGHFRVISLRKANDREKRNYVAETGHDTASD